MTCRDAFTGFVLAGGASSRMGTRKEHLIIQGETLMERQLRLLRRVCRTVAIIGSSMGPIRVDAPVIEDLIPSCGPLGGLYTALCFTRTEFNLILGCDLPRLNSRFLEFLCHQAALSRSALTVPMSGRRKFEPLCAVYRRDLRRMIGSRLREGKNKTSGFYRQAVPNPITVPELVTAGFRVSVFDNMNTWDDYRRISRQTSADHRQSQRI